MCTCVSLISLGFDVLSQYLIAAVKHTGLMWTRPVNKAISSLPSSAKPLCSVCSSGSQDSKSSVGMCTSMHVL